MKVLVVDDSSVFRRIVADSLGDIGVTDVVEAADGMEALAALEKQEFNLILMDRVMPNKGGVEVLREIRARELQTPVVIVTATGTNKEDVLEAMQAGASDYLLKPFDAASLREKLIKFCGTQSPDSPHVMTHPTS